MDKLLVLVNGLPGSGKSTLSRALAARLRADLLSKDAIKEALASCVDDEAMFPALGGIAMDTLWSLAASTPRHVVADSWWFAPRDRAPAAAGIARVAAPHTLELWCAVPPEVARTRYATRVRPPLHRDADRLLTDWPRWSREAEPLSLTPVLEVDTTGPVDIAALSARIIAYCP
ncbi:AAA family ATPase [Nocardia sp. NPDC057668]|uniref:AAA family ATPase n=1 Tax=Nocardia sp. NPDC057668 TaxID=3346202 RepID=UPI00366AEC51